MTGADLYRIRDAIAEGLRIRRGFILTDEVIRDRAANITEYLREIVDDITAAALKDAARGEVIGGLIDGARPRAEMDEGTTNRMGETGETMEQHMDRILKREG